MILAIHARFFFQTVLQFQYIFIKIIKIYYKESQNKFVLLYILNHYNVIINLFDEKEKTINKVK